MSSEAKKAITNAEFTYWLRDLRMAHQRQAINLHDAAEWHRREVERIEQILEQVVPLEDAAPYAVLGKSEATASDDPATCQHPSDLIRPGPRVPLRHGSAATAVCDACGSHRLVRGRSDDWTPGPPDTTRDEEL